MKTRKKHKTKIQFELLDQAVRRAIHALGNNSIKTSPMSHVVLAADGTDQSLNMQSYKSVEKLEAISSKYEKGGPERRLMSTLLVHTVWLVFSCLCPWLNASLGRAVGFMQILDHVCVHCEIKL